MGTTEEETEVSRKYRSKAKEHLEATRNLNIVPKAFKKAAK